jgi:hypothetical protein
MSQITVVCRLQKHRVDVAAQAVVQARNAVGKAEIAVEVCRAALEAQRASAALQEKEMYEVLCRSVVRRKKFDDVSIDLQLLKNATLTMERELLFAEAQLDKARATLRDASARYRQRMIRSEKFDTYAELERQALWHAAQATEDAVLEEAAELMRRPTS